MPRAKTILQSEFPYNITARSINKEWFKLPMSLVWQIFSEELYMTNLLYGLKIHSFVLMSNHFHLIASTPRANISQCMNYFMKMTSKRLTQAGNRINQSYSGRYYKTILQSHNYYLNAYKYNYQNPVVASMTSAVENYKYSTLHGLLGKSELLIPMVEDVTLYSSLSETLSWLNTKSSEKNREAVNWALKRPYFKSKVCRVTRKSILTDEQLI